jgi:AcrR family transcriptional regulator
MGRRSIHTPDELRELIIQETTHLVERDGLEGLSAREIAKRVGYSPGTLYNVFENLDDLLLTIEARLLDRLSQHLAETDASGPPKERLRRLIAAYYGFTQEQPKLWNLLTEHRMPAGRIVPDWYQEKIEKLLQPIEEALTPIVGCAPAGGSKRAARTLWAGVHGITSLSTTNKLAHTTARADRSMLDEFLTTYLAGLEHQRPS